MLGVVDTVVPEPAGGAHQDPDYAALLLRNFILDALVELRKTGSGKLGEERYRKFRRMGQQLVQPRQYGRDVHDLQRTVTRALEDLVERLPPRVRGAEPEPARPLGAEDGEHG
jgi:hypothetical protein